MQNSSVQRWIYFQLMSEQAKRCLNASPRKDINSKALNTTGSACTGIYGAGAACRVVYFLRRGRGFPCALARGFFLPEMRAASPPPASAQSAGTKLTLSDAVTAARNRSTATTPEEINAAAGAALLFTATNAPANDDRKTQTYAQSAAVSAALPLFRVAAAHTAVVTGIRSNDAASPVSVDLRADVFSMRVTTFVLSYCHFI